MNEKLRVALRHIKQYFNLMHDKEDEQEVVAHFKNPAMPSIASTADAAVKIASTREGFGQTDVYLEMVGFDQADIRRIKAQEARTRGLQFLTEEFGHGDTAE